MGHEKHQKRKPKFVIVSPRQQWGGAIVLHTLCKYLMEEGYDAKIFYTNEYIYREGRRIVFWLNWIIYTIKDIVKILYVRLVGENYVQGNKRYHGYINLTVKSIKRKFFPVISKNVVVIYPELVYGNFLKAKKVVRWLLYYYQYNINEKNKAYGANDLFICYREIFNEVSLNPKVRTLYVNYFDLDLYKKTNYGPRKGACYIVRKGIHRKDLPKEFDGIVIDKLTEEEKVKIFNQCEYCISYDTQTAYSSIAALCGCVSVVIPEKGKNRYDYVRDNEVRLGVAYGFEDDEIEYAKKTQSQVEEYFLNNNAKGRTNTLEFVDLCKEYFS